MTQKLLSVVLYYSYILEVIGAWGKDRKMDCSTFRKVKQKLVNDYTSLIRSFQLHYYLCGLSESF